MKIAFVSGIYFPEPGGAQIQTHNFANKLVELGHEVDSFIFNPTNIKINDYSSNNVVKFLLFLIFLFVFQKYILDIKLRYRIPKVAPSNITNMINRIVSITFKIYVFNENTNIIEN